MIFTFSTSGQVLASQSSLSVRVKHMIAISDDQQQATVDTICDAIRCLLLKRSEVKSNEDHLACEHNSEAQHMRACIAHIGLTRIA